MKITVAKPGEPNPNAGRDGSAHIGPDGFTDKQRAFIEYYMEGGCRNATDAAFKAYNCEKRSNAQSIGSQLLRKKKIKDVIYGHVEEALQRTGCHALKVAQVVADALEAKKTVMKIQETSGGDVKVVKGEIPDWTTRMKAVDTFYKVKGAYSQTIAVEDVSETDIALKAAEKIRRDRLLGKKPSLKVVGEDDG